jgi:hypothetical protein
MFQRRITMPLYSRSRILLSISRTAKKNAEPAHIADAADEQSYLPRATEQSLLRSLRPRKVEVVTACMAALKLQEGCLHIDTYDTDSEDYTCSSLHTYLNLNHASQPAHSTFSGRSQPASPLDKISSRSRLSLQPLSSTLSDPPHAHIV